jgi:ubiquinone/menaquinone biosynthesis C-methylase UbiE
MNDSPEKKQYRYFTKMAPEYDEKFVHLQDEHYLALKYILSQIKISGFSSVLDVGCGTGRAVAFFIEHNIPVKGIEPVPAMIHHARKKNNIPAKHFICGNGEYLPFPDDSFDAVCEFGVFHHLRNPDTVLNEMIRVAKYAVFLSDNNRFGHGPVLRRISKLIACKSHVWNLINFMKTRGKMYADTQGDGIVFSYSVFDSYDTLAQWADKIYLIPTSNEKSKSWFHPLLTSTHVLLCALKK